MNPGNFGNRLRSHLVPHLLRRGEKALARGRNRPAVEAFDNAIEIIERQGADERSPTESRELYGRALLLRARALRRLESRQAALAYVQAREHIDLEPSDIAAVGSALIQDIPHSLLAFPIYLDWRDQASDPAKADAQLRALAAIRRDDDPTDPGFDAKRKLNEYFAAQRPNWTWALEHLATAHELLDDLDAAHSCLVEWRAREADNPTARCRERHVAAKRHVARNQTFEAMAAFENAMASGADLSDEAAHDLLDHAKSQRLTRRQAQRLRGAFDAHLRRAKDTELLARYAMWVEDLDAEATIAALQRCLDIDPEHPRALSELAARMEQRGDLEHAMRLTDRYLRIRPNDDDARMSLAKLADRRGQFERVIELVEELTDRPTEIELIYAKGLVALGRQRDAEETLSRIARDELNEGGQREFDMLRADVSLARQAFRAVLTQCERLAERYPEDANVLLRIGQARIGLAQWSKAVEAFSTALELDSGLIQARSGRGQAYFRLDDHKRAADDFRAVLAENPRRPQIRYALALCLLDEEPEEAKRHLLQAADEAPEHEGARLAMARLRERESNWEAAQKAYAEALDLSDRDNAVVEGRLLYAALRAGDFDTARSLLEARKERQPFDLSLVYRLGYCCYKTGDLRDAALHWRMALRHRDDDELREDLGWLHIRLADAATDSDSRVTMTQHWNVAQEYAAGPELRAALVSRWAAEATKRMTAPDGVRPNRRDAQVAHDLMTQTLQFDPTNPTYMMLAALSAATLGDWRLAEELALSMSPNGRPTEAASLLIAVCREARHLPDGALSVLPLNRDWREWDEDVQRFRVQLFLESEDVAGAARELAMLRALSPDSCDLDTAISVLLNLACWRQATELATDAPPSDRTDLALYGLGVSALEMNRESAGLDWLEQVPTDSEWAGAARELLHVGYKRQALRAYQSLGWDEVVGALRRVAEDDDGDVAVNDWLTRAEDLAALSRWDAMENDALLGRWMERLRTAPTDAAPLHQWAVFAYWDAQTMPTPENWRRAMALWGGLLNQREYWTQWTLSRLNLHDARAWQHDQSPSALETKLQPVALGCLQRLADGLAADARDALAHAGCPADEIAEIQIAFNRESATADLWREWLAAHSNLKESVLPYGAALLELLGWKREAKELLSASANLQPSVIEERMLIYLSELGDLLAAVETGEEEFARSRITRYFDDEDATLRRYARIVYALSAQRVRSLLRKPYEGLETLLRARLVAEEVDESTLMDSINWSPLFSRLSDALVAEVEASRSAPAAERRALADKARDLLKRVYDATEFAFLPKAIVRVSIVQANATVARGARDGEFTESHAEALSLLHDTLALAPDHVLLQQEAAKLRLLRGVAAVNGGRLNEALIDFARAHELDPTSSSIASAYAEFMMEQAQRMWGEPGEESQREALSLAARVIAISPSDSYLLARSSRFLDLPRGHTLRQTPEYRRLATLFINSTQDNKNADGQTGGFY